MSVDDILSTSNRGTSLEERRRKALRRSLLSGPSAKRAAEVAAEKKRKREQQSQQQPQPEPAQPPIAHNKPLVVQGPTDEAGVEAANSL